MVQRALAVWVAAALATGVVAAASEDPDARVQVTSEAPPVSVTLPEITVPTLPVTMPTLPEVTVPPITVPPVTVPALPALPDPIQDVVEQVACVGDGPVPVDHDGLWLIDVDRGCARVLLRGVNPGTATFSPDGRYAVVPLETSDEPFAPNILWKVDLVSGLRRAITPPGPALGPAAWSPDGAWLAYTSGPTEPKLADPTAPDGPHGVNEIWLVRPDGSDRHRVMTGDGWGLKSWSPDGRRLAVVMRNHEHIAIVDVPSGAVRYHRTPPAYLVTWSPDGSQLAFDGGAPGDPTADIEATYLMDPATGSHRKIADDAEFPRWSPDGQWLAVHRGDNVVLLRPDGTPGPDLGQGLPLNWSTDGRYLLIASGNQDRVWDMSTGQSRYVAIPGDGPGPWPQSSRWIPGTHTFAALATTARHYTP